MSIQDIYNLPLLHGTVGLNVDDISDAVERLEIAYLPTIGQLTGMFAGRCSRRSYPSDGSPC